MSTGTVPRRRLGVPPAAALLAGCLGLAALTLLAPSIPSYDPFAWLVWGRELVDRSQTFSLAGGPSWKPLPVLFTSVFALAGGAAPGLWLLIARAGALAALAGAFQLGSRLAGRWAGVVAALGIILLAGVVALAWRGASEPLLVACVLWAIERHLAGRRGTAFALGVAAALIRPEAWPFLGLYALVGWRRSTPGERWLIAGGLGLVPLLWFGLPALTGDPLGASSHAADYNGHTGSDPAWTALRRGLALAVAPVWALALAAVVLRRHDRVTRVLALGAAGWLAVVAAMTAAGYPGLARFMLPAAAVACVLAGIGAVTLVARTRGGSPVAVAAAVAVLVAMSVALSAGRAARLGDQVRAGTHAAQLQHELSRAIAVLGGRVAVLRCAMGAAIATNHTAQTALAWKLHAPLDRVGHLLPRAGLDVHGPRDPALGAPPPIAIARPRRMFRLARVGAWRVLFVAPAGTPLPAACRRGA